MSNDNSLEKKVPNVPNLRFKEYKDFWVEKKIGDILKIKNGRSQKSILAPNGDYPIYGTGGIIGWSNTFLYDKPSVCIGRKGTINKPYFFEEPFWTVDTLFYSVINEDYVPKFVFYLFESIDWIMYNQSTSIPSLTSTVIESIKVKVPFQIEEQNKISLFLSSVDHMIDTQNKIIEEYKTLIKVICNDYFNKLEAPIVNLSNIATVYQPHTIAKSNCITNGKYSLFGANGIIGKVNKFNHENEQICITCRGSTSGNVFLSEKHSWITGNAMVINVDKNQETIDKYFLFLYLSSKKFNCIISGSGQPQITREPLLNLEIKLPNLYEQKAFSEKITAISLKIDIEKDLLSQYRKQKEYLLKNMFI